MELEKNLPWTFPHMCLCLGGGLHGPASRQTRGHSVSQGINDFRGSLGLLQTVPSSLFGTGSVISLIAAVKPFVARIFCLCANQC